MSQHDLNIANQVASTARTDINNALVALGTTLSGTSAPSLTTEGTLWYDTTNNELKIREGSSWVSVGLVSGTAFRANVELASQSEAQTGTQNTKTMTALRVKEAITAQTVSSIGVGQTWQAFSTSTRVNNVWYQNLTTLPIQVAIDLNGGGNAKIYVGTATNTGVQLASWPNNDGNYERSSFSFIVPVNHYYKLTAGTRITWAELRA
tara:strand:+ start:466 stop:1086 length:621 start_codon:yes stop_codon:yes gene_type:complete